MGSFYFILKHRKDVISYIAGNQIHLIVTGVKEGYSYKQFNSPQGELPW